MIDERGLERVRETVKALRRLRGEDRADGRETLLEKIRRWQHLEMPDLPLDQVAHRARWSDAFAELRGRLVEVWPERDLVDVQHIGSSAIPSLRSKNVVDLAIAVTSAPPRPQHLTALEACGFEPYGRAPGGPEVHWFWKLDDPDAAFVVHLCREGDPWWRSAIDFRDYLRAHPHEAQRYQDRKAELAAARRSSLAYSLGKIELLLELEERARRWRSETAE